MNDNKKLASSYLLDMKPFSVGQLNKLNSKNNYNYCTHGEARVEKNIIIDELPFIPSNNRTI